MCVCVREREGDWDMKKEPKRHLSIIVALYFIWNPNSNIHIFLKNHETIEEIQIWSGYFMTFNIAVNFWGGLLVLCFYF